MKQIIHTYTFNAAARTITFTDFASIRLERILLITNVTRNEVLYLFNDPALGGTVSGNVLTLTYNTTAMNNADKLQITYNSAIGDPVYETGVMQGAVASGATDSGNPVKVGGRYNTAVPTLTNGQRGDLQLDANGNLKANLAVRLDSTNDSIMAYPLSHGYTYISTATTTVIKNDMGHLAKIIVGETAAGAITVYDNNNASGTIIAVLKASIPEGSYEFNAGFGVGLTVVTAGASKVTVVWR